MKRAITTATISLSLLCAALANDPHSHGKDGIPDWYDPDCCNLQDCRPIDDEASISFGKMDGNTVVIWKQKRPDLPSGEITFIYTKERWRTSKDGRYHTCSRPMAPLCIYLPPSA